MRAPSAGISLTRSDAALVKAMLRRGDRQSDIASFFGVNGGRIAEISTGDRFAGVPAAEEDKLPPEGPYVSRALRRQVKRDLLAIRECLDDRDYKQARSIVTDALRRI